MSELQYGYCGMYGRQCQWGSADDLSVSFKSFDLNLLRVFDAVMAERSVLRASLTLNLTQSAVSHSLARLRDAIGDQLFVRFGNAMEPTPRALEISPAIRGALRTLQAAVELPTFDPSTSRRSFTIAASDFTTVLIVPRLLAVMRQDAPAVDLVVRPVTRIDLAEQLDVGRIDAAVGTFSAPPPRFRSTELFAYDDVLVTHRLPQEGALDLEQLARLPVAVISYGGDREGAVAGFIQERGLGRRSEMFDRLSFQRALTTLNTVPRFALSTPHFLALPELLRSSDLVAIVPRPLAEHFRCRAGLAVYELPYVSTALSVQLLWHERHDQDAAHVWLRQILEHTSNDIANI